MASTLRWMSSGVVFHQYLDTGPWKRSAARGENTAALDEVGDAVSAEGGDRHPDLDALSAARLR
jgi:hypothetical protein